MNSLAVFDIDGVVADYEGRLVEVLHSEFGSVAYVGRNQYSLEKRYENRPDVLKRALELTNNPNFYYPLGECEGAVNFIARLIEDGYQILYVSSRPESAGTFTKRWLEKHIKSTETLAACGVEDKVQFLTRFKDDVDFIVEDSPEQIKKLKEAGYDVLCWSQSWNEGIFPRLYVKSDGILMNWEDESVEASPFFGD